MEKFSPDATSWGATPQRRILQLVREAERYYADRSLMVGDPIAFARADAALVAVFEATPRDSVFSNYVTHNLSRRAVRFLQARYSEWEKARVSA